MIKRLFKSGLFVLTFYSTLLLCSLAFSQSVDFDIENPLAKYKKLPKTPIGKTVALEGVINPNEYILGPGDKLEIVVWGNIELTFELEVSPDGTLSIPGLGLVEVANTSIADAEKLIIRRSGKIYSESHISLKLVNIRLLKASIGGAVERPGIYDLSAIDRLSTLIYFAGGFVELEEDKVEQTVPVSEERKQKFVLASKFLTLKKDKKSPSLRNIRIVNKSGEISHVDLLRYQLTGDLDYNPVLRDGDQIFIPLITTEVGVIHIFGAVKTPGEYEFVDGDKLLDIVELAGGFKYDALLSSINIKRFTDNTTISNDINVDLSVSGANKQNIVLKADDRIFIRHKPEYHSKYYVEVVGEVMFPGVYAIRNDITKLTEIIELCGGFTEVANIEGSQVKRFSMIDVNDQEYERLIGIPVAEMSDMEYEYYKLKTRDLFPNVLVDFKKLFIEKDNTQDLSLKNRDIIKVPILCQTINVAGMVNNPGLVKFKPDANWNFYIKQTGGFTWNAKRDRARLIKANSGVWVKLTNNTRIEIGDTIFIPGKDEVSWWENFKDVLLVVSQVATIFVVIQTLR
ncbi:MAG: SLBB domain-containing protein [Candidatus Hatepunaea meridiana]|nr:SLBB domain-containing protein [Candidatus Hatepunaea meridiana]